MVLVTVEVLPLMVVAIFAGVEVVLVVVMGVKVVVIMGVGICGGGVRACGWQ